MSFKNIGCISAATMVSILLISCGSDSSSTASTQTPEAAKYVGTYVQSCFLSDEITQSSTGNFIYQVDTVTVTHPDTTSEELNFTEAYEFYDPTDTTCAGTSIGSGTDTSTNTIIIDGQVTIGADTVDKVTINDTAPGGLSSGGTITLNGLVFPGDYFVRTSTFKDLMFLMNTALTFGDTGGVLDADGYPTLLEVAARLTKQ